MGDGKFSVLGCMIFSKKAKEFSARDIYYIILDKKFYGPGKNNMNPGIFYGILRHLTLNGQLSSYFFLIGSAKCEEG